MKETKQIARPCGLHEKPTKGGSEAQVDERRQYDSLGKGRVHIDQVQSLYAKRPTPPRGFDYTREEAAAFLGVSKATLDTWAWARKHLAYVKVGRFAWYRRGDLEMLLRRQTRTVSK
ncbi:MAG: DNA-binding protein [Gammaproteobacteria bacterium]|nr:MAG: DNA-binding protein [Gammaproteobacteria bacterium]